MKKRELALFLVITLLSTLFFGTTTCTFAEERIVIENFNSYSTDYSLTAVNGTTTVNGKWSVYDQGNGVGTAAKAAKDTLTLETETTAVQEINQFGRITRNWPEDAATTDKLSTIYFKRNLEDAYVGTVTTSMRLRLNGLSGSGFNIYLYDTDGNMIVRLLAVGTKITVYKYTQSSPSSSVNIGYISSYPEQETWADLDITVNTYSGEISVTTGEGFTTQKTYTLTDEDSAIPVSNVACVGYVIERFYANGSGSLDIDDLAISCKTFAVTDEFTFAQISEEEQGGVTQNLKLPQTYTASDGNTYSITWSSSDESVLKHTGEVTRSSCDSIVCLTAVFSKNDTPSGTKQFYINVLAEGAYYFTDYFNGKPGTNITSYNSWKMDNSAASGQTATLENDPIESGNTVMLINRTSKNVVQRVKRLFNSDVSVLNETVWLSSSVYRKNDTQPFFMTVRSAEEKILAQIQISTTGAVSYWACNSDGTVKLYNLVSSQEKYVPYGEWCNLSVCMNYSDNTFLFYVNGKCSDVAGSFYNKYNNGSTTVGTGEIEFDIERNITPEDAVIHDLIYIDNVTVRTPADAFAVKNVYVYDKNDVAVKNLQNGGKIGGVALRIQKTLTENAQILAVLYDDTGMLINTSIQTLVPSEITSGIYNMDFSMALPETGNLASYSFRLYAWDPVTLKPVMVPYTYDSSAAPIVIYVAGDSIGATYSATYYPQCGYGQVLNKFFDSDYVTVDNRAVGGRTTLSFIDEGRLDSILGSIKNGDYLFIQFGHNDQTKQNEVGFGTTVDPNATSTSTQYTEGTYQYYLMQYINKAKAAGANPVLVTPPYRRSFDSDGNLLNSVLTPYVEAMRQLAAAQKVPLIDLNAGWTQLFKDNGITNAELAKNYYMNIDRDDPRFVDDPLFEKSGYYTIGVLQGVTGEENSNWGLPHSDGTHLNVWSAEVAAEIMINEIKNMPIELSIEQYINNYTPTCPWE